MAAYTALTLDIEGGTLPRPAAATEMGRPPAPPLSREKAWWKHQPQPPDTAEMNGGSPPALAIA